MTYRLRSVNVKAEKIDLMRNKLFVLYDSIIIHKIVATLFYSL